MRLVIFNNNHKLDINHEILYFDSTSVTTEGVEAIVDKIKEFNPDLLIEEEKNDGVSNFTQIYQMLPNIAKAWWMIDAHCNLIDHIVYAKQFEYIFCAQSWFKDLFLPEVTAYVFYLPLCHTQTMTEYQEMLKSEVKKDILFSFIGNIRSIHVDRKKYIAKFLKEFPKIFAHKADYPTTLEYLRRSEVTFNCSLNNDLNFRVWEGLACGASVLTDSVTDVDKIKGLRTKITLYDKLYPNIDYSAPLLRKTKFNSEDFIKQSHTLTHRMLQMLEMVEKGKQYSYE